jgi:hypothetical protein
MKPIVHFLLATGLATGAVSAQELYAAKTASLPVTSAIEAHGEAFPAPVTGGGILFVEAGGDESSAPQCLPVDQILGIFAMDVEAVGGEILALTGGLEQEFADQWRLTVGASPVEVSQVFAHVVPSEGGEAVVDVVEVDAKGCALSRTLLSQSDWLVLLGAVQGVEV